MLDVPSGRWPRRRRRWLGETCNSVLVFEAIREVPGFPNTSMCTLFLDVSHTPGKSLTRGGVLVNTVCGPLCVGAPTLA
jgi:hypothetical protein